MNVPPSIEFRLTAWYAVMLFVGFLVLGIVLWAVVSFAMEAAINDRLVERLERLVAAVSAEAEEEEDEGEYPEAITAEIEEELFEYVMGFPQGNLAQIRDESGRRVFPPPGLEPALEWRRGGREPTLFTTHVGSTPYRVLVQDVSFIGRRYAVSLASSMEGVGDVRDRVVTVLVVVAPLALVLCCGGGYYIARAALRPVDEITETAADITVSNLARRIPLHSSGDALERLATTINAMLERLETSVAKIEQFSADASHELRTPLAVVRTTAELALRHGRTGAGYRSDLRDIHDEAKRMSDLIEVLLSLSRGDSEHVRMAPVNLVELVSGVCEQFRNHAARKGLSLELDTSDGEVVVVINGNVAALRRMLESLLENALAHTQEGTISVALAREGGTVRLSVSDTGEGIPEESLERIFERFYRVEPARRRGSGRFGLGLSIARRIAELHAAELGVESRDGKGAKFTVRFPGGDA